MNIYYNNYICVRAFHCFIILLELEKLNSHLSSSIHCCYQNDLAIFVSPFFRSWHCPILPSQKQVCKTRAKDGWHVVGALGLVLWINSSPRLVRYRHRKKKKRILNQVCLRFDLNSKKLTDLRIRRQNIDRRDTLSFLPTVTCFFQLHRLRYEGISVHISRDEVILRWSRTAHGKQSRAGERRAGWQPVEMVWYLKHNFVIATIKWIHFGI